MKKMPVILFLVILGYAIIFSTETTNIDREKELIKNVILKAYQEGICNVGDVEMIKKGFHPGFNLLIMNNDYLEKLAIYNWIKRISSRKQQGKYPPAEKVNFKFPYIDIAGKAGMAKIEFFRGGKKIYTDFLSLYKFSDGWKIVAKIFHKH